MKVICLILVLWLISLNNSLAQIKSENPALYVDSSIVWWSYHSKTVNDDYRIYVNLPSGYDTIKAKYPVLYLTDGDWNLNIAIDALSMLEQDYETTNPIIVAIGYGDGPNKRTRDLDPATGGPNFLAFIENELMPFIKSKYRTNGNNALFGYSYGGLLTTSVLFNHPALFNTVFIGAPGDNGRQLMPAAEKYFASHTSLRCRVFVGVGSYEYETVRNVNAFYAYLLARGDKDLDIGKAIIPNGSHATALAEVIKAGVKFGYCKTHKEISLTAKQLQIYTGKYFYAPYPDIKYKLFLRGNKLYFQQGTNIPVRYVPFARDKFFLYEGEKAEVLFKADGGKRYFLFTASGQNVQRMDKIN